MLRFYCFLFWGCDYSLILFFFIFGCDFFLFFLFFYFCNFISLVLLFFSLNFSFFQLFSSFYQINDATDFQYNLFILYDLFNKPKLVNYKMIFFTEKIQKILLI